MSLTDRLRAIEQRLTAAEQSRHLTSPTAGLAESTALLDQLEPSDEASLRARALSLFALYSVRAERLEDAIRAAVEATETFRTLDMPSAESGAHCTLALAYCYIDLCTNGLHHAVEALRLADVSGDPSAQAWSRVRLAIVHEFLDDAESAIVHATDSVRIARELGPDERFATMHNLAEIQITLGLRDDPEPPPDAPWLHEALETARAAIATTHPIESPFRWCLGTITLARGLALAGEHQESLRLLRSAIELVSREGVAGFRLHLLSSYATALRRNGELEAAAALWDAESTDDELITQNQIALDEIAALHRDRGDFERALKFFEAHHHHTVQMLRNRADQQTRILVHRAELDSARLDAARARARAEHLEREMSLDPLTGLANRRTFDALLPRMLTRAHGERRPLALAILDIDRFKGINDKFGHLVGDRVLEAVAAEIRGLTRPSDLTVRLGGDEFLVVFDGTPGSVAVERCEQIRHAIESFPWRSISPALRITTSIGVAEFEDDASPADLVARADAALYVAKQRGRDQVFAA